MLQVNGEIFERNLTRLGLPCKYIRGVESPLGDTFYFNLINVAQYNKRFLKSLIEKLAIHHHIYLDLVDTRETHFAIFERKQQSTLSLSQILNQRSINIGKDINGRVVSIDFKKAPHLLIAGTTGAGKSVLLHTLLVNILNYYGSRAQLVILDPKGTEFVSYSGVRNTTYISETNKAINGLAQCEAIMDNRYRNGGYYNHEIFIVIDELADLMLTSKYEVEQSIVRIAQKGRAVGIHLIVATQSPRVQVISGLIKANMPYRIILKTTSVRESVVALDHKGSEQLQGCGDCVVKLGLEELHTKIAYCDKSLENHIISINKG